MQFLGQHFLKNHSAIEKIIGALDLKRGDVVIEIGPGKGALTIPLVERCREIGCSIVAIEKDEALIKPLATRLKPNELAHGWVLPLEKNRVQIMHGDALRLLPSIPQTLYPKPYRIVGNIPYYITGALLRAISELPYRPTTTVLMVQKEVAERVTAKPPRMNLLAAATQVWADARLLFTLPATDFDPPPKVGSAVIRLANKVQPIANSNLQNYYDFIHRAFKQPRKTLLNNLMAETHEIIKTKNQQGKDAILALLQRSGYTEKNRAQELSIEELISLSDAFNGARSPARL